MELKLNKIINKYQVLLLIIFLASFLLKLYFATCYPLIAGMDAGYYVIHIQEVFLYGYPQVSDPPIAFFIGALFTFLAGDLFLGFKIAISLFSAAICFPVYKIAKYITKDRVIGLFAAFLASFSVSNMFIMGDLFKNTIGLFFGAWFIYLLVKSIKETNMRNASLAIIAFFLMLATHFSSSAYLIFSVTPFLVLLPAYDYIKEKKITKEAKVCLFIIGGMALAGILILLLKPGLLGDYSLGPVGLEYMDDSAPGREGINLEIFSTYSIFSLLVFLGIYSSYKIDPKWALLFIPWLLISFLLTQPMLVDNSWIFRFELNSYIPISILAGLGIFYFRKEKSAFYGVMLLMAMYTLYMFAEAGTERTPLITMEEYQGLLLFSAAHPDAEIIGPVGGLAYWVQAAGLEIVADKTMPPQSLDIYIMLSVQQERKPGVPMQKFGGIRQTRSISKEELDRIPHDEIVARFGNYIIARASGMDTFPMKDKQPPFPKPPQKFP